MDETSKGPTTRPPFGVSTPDDTGEKRSTRRDGGMPSPPVGPTTQSPFGRSTPDDKQRGSTPKDTGKPSPPTGPTTGPTPSGNG